MSANPYRLPRTAIPSRYELRLEPDLDAAVFAGREVVDLEIQDRIEELVLNAVEIEIEAAHVTSDGKHIAADPIYEADLGRVTLRLESTVDPGPARLHLSFRGVLNDKLRGFYRSTFKDTEGQERVIATTQFESSDARRAFPCWDEPDLKAVFSVTLIVDEHLLAVSNSSELEREPASKGKVVVRFADTPKMSTYLVAFIVGPMEATDPVDIDGIPLRVIFPVGKGHLTRYALDVGEFCLRYLTEYYGIPYAGDKVDFVAIPDFAFGAMENLGAITYRESVLLVEPTLVGQTELQRIADIIAHELAHMWFGDLVTMRWWNGIWLNEAFAQFMEMKAVDSYRPDWKRWLSFATKQSLFRSSERFDALESDALLTTRPVEYEVISPTDADAMFDALTYGKGAAVLRMLEQFLGEETFREGIRHYLNKHLFGNTETEDLWTALEHVAGVPVRDMMDTWIFQPGFPLIELRTTGLGIEASQRRFTYTGDGHDQSWHVPLVVKSREVESRSLLTTPEVVAPPDVEFVVVNGGGHGFFRTAHPEGMLERLAAERDRLSELEQFVLIDDARALVIAGGLDAPSFLDLAMSYRDSDELAIWQVLIASLEDLFHILEPGPRADLARFVRDLLEAPFSRLGLQPAAGETDLRRKLRGSALMGLGRLGDHPVVIEAARAAFERLGSMPAAVDPDVAFASIFVTAANGDESTFAEMVHRYEKADNPQDKNRLLYALAEFPDPELAARSMEMALDGRIKTQDASYFVSRLLYHRKLHGQVWRLLTENWERMLGIVPPVTFNHVLDYLYTLSEPDLARSVEEFLAGRTFPMSEQFLPRRLEELRIHRALREREGDRLSHYLRSRYQ